MKRLLALLTALCMVAAGAPALAAPAEGEASQPMPEWGYGILADGYALGLFGDEIAVQHSQTITQQQLDVLARTVADKLALLEVDPRPASGPGLVIDTTRGGVMNALYQQAAAYAFPGVEKGAEPFMTAVGAIAGDGTGDLALDRPCTVLEGAAMANSLILGLYDQQGAGAQGLLWRAEGNGNTLYLLGSIHVDRGNIYPFHKQLRDTILGAEEVAFELDFNDLEQQMQFAAMQLYTDGTTLADHVEPGLYQAVVDVLGELGTPEETVAQYKAWALAGTLQNLALIDESTGETNMAIDLYVNAKAANAAIPIEGVETYAFQGGLFDSLSPGYQEKYLAGGLLMLLDLETMDQQTRDALVSVLGPQALEPEGMQAVQEQLDQIDDMLEQWKRRDVDGFIDTYDKQAILDSGDELERKLFTGRDPGMIDWAGRYLAQEGDHTGLLVVGAGHMVGSGGIVQGLKDLGYTVEVVEKP